MLQLEQIQWQTDGSALLRLSDREDVRILAFSVTELSLHEGQQLSHDMSEQIQSAGRFREIYKKSLDLLADANIPSEEPDKNSDSASLDLWKWSLSCYN